MSAPIRPVALVTGAATGIGAAVAARLAIDGAAVVGTFHRQRFPDSLRDVRGVATDVRDPAALDGLVADIVDNEGPVDVLVHCAASLADRSILRLGDEAFDEQVELHLGSAFRLLRRVAPGMAERRWGRIILFSSISAIVGLPAQANYAAPKAGLAALAKVAAREFGPRGVTVNVVAPGAVDTPLVRAQGDHLLTSLVPRVPLGRLGRPAEVAALVAWLASPVAASVTGQVIPIDGGLTATVDLTERGISTA